MNCHIRILYMTDEDVGDVCRIDAASFAKPWQQEELIKAVHREDTIYLVATVSGSQIRPNAHQVALLESDSLLKAYNKSNFDIEKEKFAKLLPDECYDFPNKELDIQAGTSKVMFPIYLKNLEKISPDSIYFLDYKIDQEKTPNYNPDKSHVL